MALTRAYAARNLMAPTDREIFLPLLDDVDLLQAWDVITLVLYQSSAFDNLGGGLLLRMAHSWPNGSLIWESRA